MAYAERPILEELLDLSEAFSQTMTDYHTRLRRLVQRAKEKEKETEDISIRYKQLEASLSEAVTSAKWLRVQNAELERQLEEQKPSMTNALSAREGAFRKLKHARKVIRDLLDERGDLSPRAVRSSSIKQEDIDQALFDEFLRDEDSPSTDSDKTVRLAPVTPGSPRGTPQPLSPWSNRSGARSITSSKSPKSEHSIIPEPLQASVSSMEVYPNQARGGNGSPSQPWHIQFKKAPGCSVLTEGPFPWSDLQRFLGMAEDMMESLQSLALSPDMNLRLQITRLPTSQNVAFLYDPIFLENRQKTYILDWGNPKTNQNIAQYITQESRTDPVLHTFTFPKREDNWYYIGAQRWSVVKLEDIWPLREKSRTKIIKKLCQRSRGEIDEAEMARLLDSGELVQLCVELTSVEDASVSEGFVQDVLGYRSPP
ncbi:hypothetical protein B0H34DRAFT_241816 [Crassisporium funariophilum]|nr:hypothetical protein B0H34DRAFT_241816 [Crassisporium funariophilum]